MLAIPICCTKHCICCYMPHEAFHNTAICRKGILNIRIYFRSKKIQKWDDKHKWGGKWTNTDGSSKMSLGRYICNISFFNTTLSNGNIFRVNGPLCGEFTGQRWTPRKGQGRGALTFSLICSWINGWVNNRQVGYLRCRRTHYDVTVMNQVILFQDFPSRWQSSSLTHFSNVWLLLEK